jgi:hypothetical protein
VFPLLLLLDAAVQCRKQGNAPGQGGIDISDAVAEVGLTCLEVLLTKCRLTSVNQVTRLILLYFTHLLGSLNYSIPVSCFTENLTPQCN